MSCGGGGGGCECGARCTSRAAAAPSSSPRRSALVDELVELGQLEDGGMRAELAEEGVGGTYFIRIGDSRPIAVFKPRDEEPGSEGNPRGYGDTEDLRGDIPPGESWHREVVAYHLDHGHFARVPETARMRIPNKYFPPRAAATKQLFKEGSLQRFLHPPPKGHTLLSWDVGPARFPVRDVHRIAIFDLRTLNCDRHGGNMLVMRSPRDVAAWTPGEGGAAEDVESEDRLELFPIDHAYILPYRVHDLEFEWLQWPQSKLPLGPEELNYIRRLNLEEDCALLEREGIDDHCIELFKAATLTLQIGAESGKSVRDIGNWVRRERLYELGHFEQAVVESRGAMEEGANIDFDLFAEKVRAAFST